MAERLTRRSVKLAAGLPDGNLSQSVEDMAPQLLRKRPPDVAVISLLTPQFRRVDLKNDNAETITLKTAAIEVLADGVFPFDIKAGESVSDVLDRLRADRTGEAVLPTATDAEAADHDQAVMDLRDWAAAHLDEGTSALAAEWDDYFGRRSPAGTVTSWRDAPTQMIREFLAFKAEGGQTVPPFEVGQPGGPETFTEPEDQHDETAYVTDPESGTPVPADDLDHDEFTDADTIAVAEAEAEHAANAAAERVDAEIKASDLAANEADEYDRRAAEMNAEHEAELATLNDPDPTDDPAADFDDGSAPPATFSDQPDPAPKIRGRRNGLKVAGADA